MTKGDKMKIVPIKFIELFNEVVKELENVSGLSYVDFEFKRRKDKDLQLTQEHKDIALGYDINNIANKLLSVTNKNNAIHSEFSTLVAKKDRKIVLTEMILKGLYPNGNVGNIFPLEFFAYEPICPMCGQSQEIFYSNKQHGSNITNYNIGCSSCGHTRCNIACTCEKCSIEWEKAQNRMLELSEYFNNGISFLYSNYDIKGYYEIKNESDILSFMRLLRSEAINFGNLHYAIEDSDKYIIQDVRR